MAPRLRFIAIAVLAVTLFALISCVYYRARTYYETRDSALVVACPKKAVSVWTFLPNGKTDHYYALCSDVINPHGKPSEWLYFEEIALSPETGCFVGRRYDGSHVDFPCPMR